MHFHVSTQDGDRFRIEVYRLGWYGGFGARLMTCLPSCEGADPGYRYGKPSVDSSGVIQAAWPKVATLHVPDNWVSGYYYALLRLTHGGDETGARAWVVFIVRDPPSRHSQVLVQVPVNTWQAYNPWGGKSLYAFNSTAGVHASRVSFERPLAYTAQGPFEAEYNFVRFLEREGYDVSYQTDSDTDADPQSLLEHRLVVVVGHDEYWSKRMRDALDAARDAGTNLALPDSPPSPDCVKPGLTVLFRYQGYPADAHAVRYTAPSGARVFAGGAQNLSWPLDTFNLRRFGHTAPTDPQFQAFMRSALGDLIRPAPPSRVRLKLQDRTITLEVRRPADSRVKYVDIFRSRGPKPFALTDAGVVRICHTMTRGCRQRHLRPGRYRFAAVAVDEWGTSAPTFSRDLFVRPKRRPGYSRT
jgi:N,N-dimethylformamidase beta subunit-like, C-terminal